MGGNRSSSKRKSSKRKSDEKSSRKKKKIKSQRKDSKKRHRVKHSVSSLSDDDSLNSEYTSSSDYQRKTVKSKKHRRIDSSSSSDTDISLSTDSDLFSSYDKTHKTKKSQKSRIHLRSRKKITRKIFSSSDDERYAENARKRKRSGIDRAVKSGKKKNSSKKKPRKDFSSDSESCSTCPTSRSTEDDKHSRKASHDQEIERWGDRNSDKAHKKRKVRSQSCSSCSNSSDQNGVGIIQCNDALVLMSNNPQRLRSVIFVPDQTIDDGGNELEKDLNKEEIVYDRDDYPSPKSVDTDEGENNRESDDNFGSESNKKILVENVTSELINIGNFDGEQINHESYQEHRVHIEDFEKTEKNSSASAVATSSDDLESILRQKALENLMKFRGGDKGRRLQSQQKSSNEIDTITDVQIETKDTESNNSQERPSSNQEFSWPIKIEKCSFNNQQKHLGHENEEKKISTNVDSVVESSLSKSDIITGSEVSNKEPILDQKLSEEPNMVEPKRESSDNSQCEEKTMSVLRGGEMVEVSYKVYIPKKTPALARRQLRR